MAFTHRAYGIRKDGTLGPAEPDNPVAEMMIVPRGLVNEANPVIYWFSDGTRGPINRRADVGASSQGSGPRISR